jgi:hypothetical protein
VNLDLFVTARLRASSKLAVTDNRGVVLGPKPTGLFGFVVSATIKSTAQAFQRRRGSPHTPHDFSNYLAIMGVFAT